MGENSSIEWCHHTFNPWVGCQRVSPGCENCYAEAYDKRVGGGFVTEPDSVVKNKRLRWGPTAPRTKTSEGNWRKPLKWNQLAKLAGQRHRVFCASLADVFEDRHELEMWRLELFELVRLTPNLDWLLLTKRPENWKRLVTAAIDIFPRTPDVSMETVDMLQAWVDGSPPENVWLGTTVEDQRRANERIPHLLDVPAAVHFLSMEPLLEPVDLSQWLEVWGVSDATGKTECSSIDWLIIGGESGGQARPFEMGWAIDLVGASRAAGAAPFVKQMGSKPTFLGGPLKLKDHHGGDPEEWPQQLRVREFPEVRR